MQQNEYDLIVIGSGPAGEKGAAQAAYFGKRVALVEKEPVLGGAAANTGTLPSKTLRETALYLSGFRQRGLYGIHFSLKDKVTARDFLYREQQVVQSERARVADNLKRHHVDLFHGFASFRDPHTVGVQPRHSSEALLRGKVFLIATGSHPHHPPQFPFHDARVYDSDTILNLREIPQTMLIAGGGVIGCEYACLFAALGIRVPRLSSAPGRNYERSGMGDILVERGQLHAMSIRQVNEIKICGCASCWRLWTGEDSFIARNDGRGFPITAPAGWKHRANRSWKFIHRFARLFPGNVPV